MPLSFYLLKPVQRVREYPLDQLIIQGLLWLFAGHAALVLPAEAGEVSDRVLYMLLMEKLLKLSLANHPGFIVVICRACHSRSTC
jgi:hypothetical protein